MLNDQKQGSTLDVEFQMFTPDVLDMIWDEIEYSYIVKDSREDYIEKTLEYSKNKMYKLLVLDFRVLMILCTLKIQQQFCLFYLHPVV